VEEVFTNAIDVLSKEDQKLPQVENLLPLLKRGIGIHHGGTWTNIRKAIYCEFVTVAVTTENY
jgi:ATP-dependent RNA helicase DOB1